MTKPRQNSSIWSCVRRRRNGKCRRANGARRKPSSPSCSKTGSSWHDGQPAPHTRFLIVPRLGRRILQEASRLRGIAGLAGGEHEADRAAEPSHGEVDLGGQAAARASDRLIASPPFAPLACWWARTIVESMIRYPKYGSSVIPTNSRFQTPLRLQRLKRRNTLF